MNKEFTHLHLHTAYSINTGSAGIEKLINFAIKNKITSLAITDHLNLFAAIKFYRKCIENRIKPIIGCEVPIRNIYKGVNPNIILLCQNIIGYKNLIKLISAAHFEKDMNENPTTTIDQLEKYNEGLILLTGGRNGLLGKNLLLSQKNFFKESLNKLTEIFKSRFYVQIERTQREFEKEYNNQSVLIAEEYELPLIATNDVQFLTKNEFQAHEIRVCINKKIKLEDRINQNQFTEEQFFKSQEDMERIFDDLPDALQNITEVIKRCNFHLDTTEYQLPKFKTPDGEPTDNYFERLALSGLKTILEKDKSLDEAIYEDRLKKEMQTISKMGFASYFLIVYEFISWAKNNSIPVGPGRGSGAGSLVAYVLNITSIDPIKHNLLFERFLNLERISLPDFDIDFCVNNRQKVIDHIVEIYGEDKVSQIITYGSMTARAVIRDVGRVLGLPYGFVDKIAKQIPFVPGITIDESLSQNSELKKEYKNNDDIKTLIDFSKELEGLPRNISKHAAGIVIAPSNITNYMPIYRVDESNELVTQFDKDDIENLGLIKFDILGLRTLTIIDKAIKTISKKSKDIEFDFQNKELDDNKVFKLLQNKLTTGVFQLESFGMKRYMGKLKPDCFNDIVALVALYRPGPLGTNMVDDFISNKHGREVNYEHPLLEDILSDTYGLILYQEQVMEISRSLANYTLGEADLLRRAMGKKKKKEMELHRKKFLAGSEENGINKYIANSIFSKMEKFAGYGFNKSHSVAYANIAYQTAYLKSYYPSEFLAAAMSSDMDKTDKIITLNDACKEMGINIQIPNINSSNTYFESIDRKTILFGLAAIKGVGNAASVHIVNEREKNGPYENIYNFCERVPHNIVNIGTLESLVYSGSFDVFGEQRNNLINILNKAISYGQQRQTTVSMGQKELFTNDSASVMKNGVNQNGSDLSNNGNNKYSKEQILSQEKNMIGFYLSGHPIKEYQNEISEMSISNIYSYYNEFYSSARANQAVDNSIVCGVIINVRQQRVGQDKFLYIITVDDSTARMQVILFAEIFFKYKSLITENKILFFQGKMSIDDFDSQLTLRATGIFDFEEARKKFSKKIELTLDPEKSDSQLLSNIDNLLEPYKNGSCQLTIKCETKGHTVPLVLDKKWYIIPSTTLINNLKDLLGHENIKVKYQ